MKLRKKKYYFERVAGAPEPVTVELKRRARFSEVDVMGVVWHGRYPAYFEEASAEIKRRTWFDVKNHPRAEFVSSSLTPLGADRYRVSGRMNIKGNARDVSSDFIVKTRQGLRVFEGKFILNRLDFRIGEGAWSDTGTVASEVEVVYRFSVTAGHGE